MDDFSQSDQADVQYGRGKEKTTFPGAHTPGGEWNFLSDFILALMELGVLLAFLLLECVECCVKLVNKRLAARLKAFMRRASDAYNSWFPLGDIGQPWDPK